MPRLVAPILGLAAMAVGSAGLSAAAVARGESRESPAGEGASTLRARIDETGLRLGTGEGSAVRWVLELRSRPPVDSGWDAGQGMPGEGGATEADRPPESQSRSRERPSATGAAASSDSLAPLAAHGLEGADPLPEGAEIAADLPAVSMMAAGEAGGALVRIVVRGASRAAGARPLPIDVLGAIVDDIDTRGAGEAPSGLLSPRRSVDGEGVEFRDARAVPRVEAAILAARDERGRDLAAKLHILSGPAPGDRVEIVVDAQAAVGPITVELRVRDLGATDGTGKGDGAPETEGGARVVPVLLAPPSNDTCSGAIAIPNGVFPALTAPVDVADATTTGDPAVCAAIDRTVWYTFTAPATGTYLITSCWSGGAIGTSMPDTVVAIYAAAGGCGAVGAPLGCNDDDLANPPCACATPGRPGVPSGKQSNVSVGLTGGTTYYILAGRYAGVGQTPVLAGYTTIQLRIDRALPPANDSCSGAVPALGLDTPLSGSTLFAADDYRVSQAPPDCFTLPGPPLPLGNTSTSAPGRDVVYSFTAPAAGSYSFRATGYSTVANQNLVLYVATSCPVGPPPVTVTKPPCAGASNRNSGQGAEEVMCLAMTQNQQVFVFVDDGLAGNPGSYFKLEVNRCLRETEQNGTTGTADPLTCPVTASINPAGDVDFYVLGTPASGRRIFAMADGVASNDGDQQMRITTSTDTLEFDDDNNDPPFGTLSPNVSGTIATGVTSYARINSYSAATASEPYRLYQVTQPAAASATIETEPNDTLAAANGSSTDYFSGALAGPAPSTDVDVYKFTARAGVLITLQLDGDPLRDNTPLDAGVELLDADGNILAYVNDTAGSGHTSSTASGAGSLTSTTPFSPGEALTYRATASGTYYARVSIGTTATSAYGAGDYLLSIGLNCFAGDSDLDGVADGGDCAPFDSACWTVPTEARNLLLAGKSPTQLSWTPPADSGALPGFLSYDVLRSSNRSNFGATYATCVALSVFGTTTSDSGPPPGAGSAWYYLVRARNLCGGNLGTTSSGSSRTGRTCP